MDSLRIVFKSGNIWKKVVVQPRCQGCCSWCCVISASCHTLFSHLAQHHPDQNWNFTDTMASFLTSQYFSATTDCCERHTKRKRLNSSCSDGDQHKDLDEVSSINSYSPQIEDFFPNRPIPRNKSISSCLSRGVSIPLNFSPIDESYIRNNGRGSVTRSHVRSPLMACWGWFVPVDK